MMLVKCSLLAVTLSSLAACGLPGALDSDPVQNQETNQPNAAAAPAPAAQPKEVPTVIQPLPLVIGNRPNSGSAGAGINTTLGVTFTRPMDPATINSTTFTIQNSNHVLIPGTVSYFGKTATFAPSADLPASTL